MKPITWRSIVDGFRFRSTHPTSLIAAPKDDVPTLVQEPNGIDAGTPKWAKDYPVQLRRFIRAEGSFFFKCTGGKCRYAQLISTKNIFIKISPNSFTEGDIVTVTFDLDRYDQHVLFDKKSLVLKILLQTGKGRRATLRFKCKDYDAEPMIF